MQHGRLLRRVLALLLVLILPVSVWPASAAGKSKPSRLTGTVKDSAGKPLEGVQVILTPLESRTQGPQQVASGAHGKFAFNNLEYGLYDVAFIFQGKAFAGNRVLMLPPAKKVEANFKLSPFQGVDKEMGLVEGQKVTGTELLASGVGRLEERLGPSGWAWFRTGKGVAVLVGSGAAIVGGLIALSGNDKPISPSQPSSR